MKVLFSVVLVAGLAVALVDEQSPAGVVQESKKTDLIISANGQTIKINTDAGHRKAVGASAARFRLNKQFVRVKTRRADETEPENPEDAPITTQEAAADGGLDEELKNLADVINHLSELRSQAPTADASIELQADQVDTILDLLENYEKALNQASAESEGDQQGAEAAAEEDDQVPVDARRRARRQQFRVPAWKHRPAFIKRPNVAVPHKGFARRWHVAP